MINGNDATYPHRPNDGRLPEQYGLTKRELFAAHLASNSKHAQTYSGTETLDVWAKSIWARADALMRNA